MSERPKFIADLTSDQFFLGTMRDDKTGRAFYGAISPNPIAVPMMFALAFLVGVLTGALLP